MDVRDKVIEVEEALNSQFLDREEEIHGLALALLSKQHILLLGPPGTAKTRIVELWCRALGLSYFRRQVNQFTDPSELFGPLDVMAFKEEGIYRRLTKGKAADCEVFQCDEVFKGSTSILNTMLSLMEERIYDNDGQAIEAPLMSLIGATNELPAKDEGLEAFYDRFLFRFHTGYIEEASTFEELLHLTEPEWTHDAVLTSDDLKQAHEEIKALPVADDTYESVRTLWEQMQNEELRPSDRRWRQVLKAMAAESWLQGMPNVTPSSIMVARHILWNDPAEKMMVERLVRVSINARVAEAEDIYKAAVEAKDALAGDRDVLRSVEVAKELASMLESMDKLGDNPQIKALRTKVTSIRRQIMERVAGGGI